MRDPRSKWASYLSLMWEAAYSLDGQISTDIFALIFIRQKIVLPECTFGHALFCHLTPNQIVICDKKRHLDIIIFLGFFSLFQFDVKIFFTFFEFE